ncbi:CaaX prenyl proteinase Rce1 [Metarhizium acridum CQMa 102]|uniref:intramembrane prenyl-peptidase Rce1 n=1 Tax=Metarhizium acridum (strain CQMa 102) TaxID=655827 RepID=E9DW89_METAQ|nr:CaaX prenyl proteinase Rce1 [Metarhizium acridum CQMa 102]EFY91939.1 CaaX prenyl proteinase Rce1 [Metarhizium acridum CQMa 102]
MVPRLIVHNLNQIDIVNPVDRPSLIVRQNPETHQYLRIMLLPETGAARVVTPGATKHTEASIRARLNNEFLAKSRIESTWPESATGLQSFADGEPFGANFKIVYCLVYVLPLHVSASTRAAAVMVAIRTLGAALGRLGYVEEYGSRMSSSSFSVCTWPMAETYTIMQGPITEECLFRSAAVPLLLVAGCSIKRIIFFSPLAFGLAHLHHFYEFRVTHPETPLVAAIARSILQLSYTSVFGAYATFIFLRTGSLLSVIAVHTLCNSIGLPRVWGVLEPYWLSDNELSQPSNVLKWTVPYYVLLLGGSILWWQNISSLTTSPMALAEF